MGGWSCCFVIVGVSLVIEKLLHHLSKWLLKKEKLPLYLALEKIKEELMLLGFISLLLTVFQDGIEKWCISEKLVKIWLPCHYKEIDASSSASGGRRLLAEAGQTTCKAGEVPFISIGVLHDLHYLIFILAIAHVVNNLLIVLLGEMKIRQWRKWEESIRTRIFADNATEGRVIDIRSYTFIKDHYEGIHANKRSYVISFFKHLAGNLTKSDYTAMRTGFILTHCNQNQGFNFHKYIVYAYEADFHKIVSIRWFMWLFVALSLTLNVAGWHIYFGISFIPFVLLLILGTKLQHVITELATHIAQRNSVVFGELRIEPSDEYFWCNRPKIVLFLIHIILFMNSFGSSIYIWTLFMFGSNSCVMGEAKYVYPRFWILGQIICSYSTLPLYAIVTQMGSSYNKEAMERYGSHITTNRDPQESDATLSVEMSNHLEHR